MEAGGQEYQCFRLALTPVLVDRGSDVFRLGTSTIQNLADGHAVVTGY